jgi:hypothetical protein
LPVAGLGCAVGVCAVVAAPLWVLPELRGGALPPAGLGVGVAGRVAPWDALPWTVGLRTGVVMVTAGVAAALLAAGNTGSDSERLALPPLPRAVKVRVTLPLGAAMMVLPEGDSDSVPCGSPVSSTLWASWLDHVSVTGDPARGLRGETLTSLTLGTRASALTL